MTPITELATVHEIWDLITPAERRSAVVLMSLMLIGMALAMLGVELASSPHVAHAE